MAATCDVSFGWADRAAQRGLALSFASNAVLSALAWPAVADYYDARVSLAAAGLLMVSAGWYMAQTLRGRFRRRDYLVVVSVLILGLAVVALSPTRGAAPRGWTWTQGWAVSCVCGAVLLLPRRHALPAIVGVTGLQWVVRVPLVTPGIAMVEGVIPVVGALITAWAARSATERFARAGAALQLAARTEEQVAEVEARAEARRWWNRILHDKVLGALLLTSRATSPVMLAQAKQLAQDALATLSTLEYADEADRRQAAQEHASNARGPAPALRRGLADLAAAHGLVADLGVRGTDGSAPTQVTDAVLAAADQALRNVAEHSGQGRVRIRATQSMDLVRVEIRDDGAGFDDSAIGTRRLGLRSSIPGHMALIDGTAVVTSHPGRGTTIVLSWAAAGAADRGASITLAQLRAWWWITLIFSGLHLIGGMLQGGSIVTGTSGWVGLSLLLIAYALLHGIGEGVVLITAEFVVIVACALMLWSAPHSVTDGWRLWFLGASHPALVIPALRGRPAVSLVAGAGVFCTVVAEFALSGSGFVTDSLQLALPFLIIPAVGALYAVTLARADRRLRLAQGAQATARRRLHDLNARQHLVSARLTSLAPGTVALLEKLVAGEIVTGADRAAARLMEAANRDQLVAAEVLNPAVVAAVARARSSGATVHLTGSEGEGDDPRSTNGGRGDITRAEALSAFRACLVDLCAVATAGDELTARWQPANSYASGTLILGSDQDPGAERYLTIRPLTTVATAI